MHAKTLGRLSGAFALAVAFAAVNSSAPFAVTPAEATEFSQDMVDDRSHEIAQAHIDRFFEFAMSPAAAHAMPRVQVMMNDKTFWIEPSGLLGDKYSGIAVENGKARHVEFDLESVRDWTFVGRDRKIYGSFRTRARLSQLSPQHAKPILSVLASSATPANWPPRLLPQKPV